MREIRATPPNGLTVASTFSGAGGSCLGYRMAGYRVAWANEFTEASAFLYAANADPDTILDRRDVRKIESSEILEATGLEVGELDVLDGSPPCDSFSLAGKREAGWGKEKLYSGGVFQRTDDLFVEYIRLVRELRPRAFVAENVTGLLVGKARGYFKEILAALDACGYAVKARVLDAQWLGVPQTRQRVIFIGVRRDLGFEASWPRPLPYRYSTAEACPWIKRITHDTRGLFSTGEFTHRPAPAILGYKNAFDYVVLEDRPLSRSERAGLRSGELGTKPKKNDRGRRLSIAECKRICGFPDDFKMDGPFKHSWRALGMSVPPPMARAVVETLRGPLGGIDGGS